jgi:AI-2 transport protein TqsA
MSEQESLIRPALHVRVQTVCLMILAGGALAVGLHLLKAMLIPFTVALFFVYAISPLVDLQVRRLRMPRALAITLTLVVSLMVLFAVAGIIAVSVQQVLDTMSSYDNLLDKSEKRIIAWLAALGLDDQTTEESLKYVLDLSRGVVATFFRSTANSILSLLSQGLIVVIFVLFLLLGTGPDPAGRQSLSGEVANRVRLYVVTKVLISTLTGVLVGGILALLGVQPALVFGLFAFLLNFIPSIGSFIATLLPLPVILFGPGIELEVGILALLLPGSVQFLLGSVMEPRILGHSLSLHPVTVVLALIFWGTVWGTVGMFLAAPLTAVARFLLERMELTRPVAHVLSGRLDLVGFFSSEPGEKDPDEPGGLREA